MKVEKLINAVVANTTGDAFSMPRNASINKDEMLAHIDIPGTATVAIEGRLHSDLPWVQLLQVATSGIYPLAFVPELRGVVTGWSSGATSAYIGWY